MAEPTIMRVAARSLPPAAGALVSVGVTGPATRFSFRGSREAAEACAAAFGCALPDEACRAAEAGERAALWLGPDEWLLLASESDTAALFASLEAALTLLPHALVDISHRQLGLTVTGAEAATLLNTGCPLDLDLSAFPVGMCTRTILGKCDIVLWRRASDTFRLEVNRSFSDYLVGYLRMAERGLG